MSQAGNVLHLYVEVRSGTEEGESRRRSASRHSVSFQPHLQSRSNGESPPMRARSSETECILGRNSQPSPLTGRNTTPTTPTSSGRRSCEVSDTGRRSVVTFSYIEKANVMSVERMPEETLSPTRTNLGHSIARAATHRALEEFGSPQLRCRGANASPILVRALPQKEGNQLGYHNHLSSPTNQMAPSMSPLSKLKSQETAPHQSPGCARPGTGSKGQPRPGGPPRVSFTHSQLNQLSRTKDASPANSPELARKLAEEATKLSSMFKEARKSRSPSPSLSPHLDRDSKGRQSPLEMNIPLHGSPKQLNNWSQGDPSSPAILSTWHRGAVQSQQASPSPIRDPRQQQTITDSPTLHRHLPPQYTGGDWSPRCQSKYSQESDKPAVEQTWEVGSVTPDSDESQSDHNTPNQDQQNVVVTDLDMLAKVEAQAEGSSRSSSGVTGSLVGQPDWDCVSPESSQSSQKSSDTGHTSSGMPSDGSSSPVGPSLHSQRIARAKWKFLFGTVPEDITSSANVDASTAPPSGTSSESPTPTPPFALPVRPVALEESPGFKDRLIGHNVEHVEVEFVTPPPDASFGASPKTGIIRRALKYSETDLDAVPLRCYRETNIDEVLAEQEADSAFGSNRSELGSGPGGGTLYTKANEEEEEEEVEEEDEVVSWASVRMQGDRKRQHATHEEDEVYCMLLKRPLDSLPDCPGPLKSPIPVNGPRRISEDGLDTFSRHFESILESHRAKGTSYSSLDSEELLSSSQPVFTFDLPTLTPEIQSQICESARDIIELSFAPLVQGELTSATHPADSSQSVSDATQAHAGEDEPTGDTRCEQELWDEIQPCFREKAHHRTADTDHEHGRHAGNTDTLLNGSRVDSQAARRLAKRLYHLDGFKKSDVSRHLSKNNEFNHRVAEEYLRFFDFRALPLDQALRVFLKKFALIGETQERERVLSHFSRRYFHCNPNSIPSEDSVHALTCAVMLLNTDLHGHNIGKRMSCMQFIGNLEGLNEGQNFPKDLLKMLYNSIKNEKLQWTLDEEESFSELADKRTDATSHTMKRISTGGNPFVSMAQQPGALVYKNGFLTRKVHADSDGKKTPRGKRGWKTFYAILKGLILYLQKGEYRPEKQMSDEDLKNAVSIHHSLAMRAADYSKRPNVFYLRTADWRVFLFQAPNAEQMQSWITRINTVAAMFSAPPFPAAIGSQRKFSRPLLPGSASKLTQEEQVQSHENRFRSTTSELTELRSSPPDRKVKGRELEEYRLREEYLEFEKTRYGTYAMLLRAKIRSGHNDLSTFESRLYEDNGLQRAHSSPTLQQEGGANNAPAAKARKGSRRGESQRQSYRQTVKL